MTWTKYTLALVLAGALLLPSPLFAASKTETQLREQVRLLLQRVAELEAKLNGGIASVAAGTLEIENVRSEVDGDVATVSWTTTLPAESRLALGNGKGKVYESRLGTKHIVTISDLSASQEYDFKLTARSADKKGYDDFYDSFTAKREYQASLVGTKGECSTIRIEDTAGKPAKKFKVAVSGILATSKGNTARGNLKDRTDSKGEFKYCQQVSTLRVKGMDLDAEIEIPPRTTEKKSSNVERCGGLLGYVGGSCS